MLNISEFIAENVGPKTNQTSKSEPTQAAPPVEQAAKPEEKVAPQYGDLARKEAIWRSKVQAREQALAQKEAAIKAKEAQYETSYIPKAQITELFQKDPGAALKNLGMTYEQMAQALLNQPGPQDRMINELREEIRALKDANEKVSNRFTEQEKSQREEAIKLMRSDLNSLVKSGTEYEAIKETQSEEKVIEYILEMLDKTGKFLNIDEAANDVEQELREGIIKYAQLGSIKDKIQALFQPKKEEVPATKTTPSQPLKTLAHAQVSTASKPMDRVARAIAAFEGRLNQN